MSDEQHPPLRRLEGGHTLAQAIVDTIREPLLVLDRDLRVVAASRSFFLTFQMNRPALDVLPVHLEGQEE